MSTGDADVSVHEPRAEGSRSNARYDLVERQIIQEATRLFAERGFSGTSLKDIADATGLTRPALYHYVKNKDELLEKLVLELVQEPAHTLRAIREDPRTSSLEKLRRMAYEVALRQATEPDRFKLLVRSEADLPPTLAELHLSGRREVLREIVLVIESGISAGELRAVQPRIAALSVLGQCNWVAWWHHPGGDSSEHVATTIADLAVASLAADDPGGAAGQGTERALAMLKRDVEFLEHVLKTEQATD